MMLRVWRGEARYLRAALFLPLWFLSWVYRICLGAREYLYRAGLLRIEKASIPVVSVGNITVGGTGKTPIVELLSRKLKANGFRPGIVTRGYKRKRTGTFSVDPKRDDAASVGDEAFMLAKRTSLPVVVGTKRIEAIELGMREHGIDVAVLDDGYQVRNLRKEMEILVLSGRPEDEGGMIFPLGPYREPFQSIRRADAVLVSKGELSDGAREFAQSIPTFKVSYRPVFLRNLKRDLIGPCVFLKGKHVLAFSGLGDNRSFFELLRAQGANVVHEIGFADHHEYSADDMEKISSYRDVEMLVTTEKDAVKMSGFDVPKNLFYLAIEATVENEEELIGRIVQKLRGK
jgi:tetraacyldisaccharide 4'-kinase